MLKSDVDSILGQPDYVDTTHPYTIYSEAYYYDVLKVDLVFPEPLIIWFNEGDSVAKIRYPKGIDWQNPNQTQIHHCQL